MRGLGRLEATSFWGSKHYDALALLPYGLEKTVRWGTLGFLARPLLFSLPSFQSKCRIDSSWGWTTWVRPVHATPTIR